MPPRSPGFRFGSHSNVVWAADVELFIVGHLVHMNAEVAMVHEGKLLTLNTFAPRHPLWRSYRP